MRLSISDTSFTHGNGRAGPTEDECGIYDPRSQLLPRTLDGVVRVDWNEDPPMDVSLDVAERIERRLDAMGLRPEEVDARVGLPPGTTDRLRERRGPIPGGRFLRGLCAALDTDEEYLLGLEPGDLMPAELLVEPQGQLGLLAPDEEALLKHYRGLSVPLRAAIALLIAKAAGMEEEQVGDRALRDAAKPKDTRERPRAKRNGTPRLFG